MITPENALNLLTMLAIGGLRAPDGAIDAKGRAMQARLYAMALNAAGVTLDEAEAAVVTYLAEPDPSQYPKPWPDPGKLIARTPRQRAHAAIPDDGDALWHLALRAARNSSNPPAAYGESAGTDAAVRAGLDAIGGLRRLGLAPDTEHRGLQVAFVRAANAERTRQRTAPPPVALLPAPTPEAK